ncbi:MAG: hypothetical protein ACTSPV_10570 [Candidatus Hodarchaeales archaeon]
MEAQIMQQVVLRGKIVDLKEVKEETEEEQWQTESLRKQIEAAGLRKKGFTMPLDGEDVTKEEYKLAEEFMPDIQLSGLELRGERKGKSWGGAFFRIIKNTNDQDERVIQWIYVWTKQRFFISFWVTVLPLLVLTLMSLLIYTYLDFTKAVISVIAIGGTFFLIGLAQVARSLKGLAKGAFYFSNQHLFLLFGVIFWGLLAEIYFSKGASSENVLQEAEIFHPDIIFPGEELIQPIIKESLKFSYVSGIFFVLAILALIFWKWEPPAFTHATHAMDWAPFFIYIRKKNNGWELEKVRYDAFHYFAETMEKGQLEKKKVLSGRRPRFEIPNFWHSFKPLTGINSWFKVLFGFLIIIIGILLGLIAFMSPDTKPIASATIRFVIVPMILFLGAYFTFSKWPTPIVDKKKMDLSDPIYHLTENRVKIFWNLRGEEPALKVRSKLQDPFMEDEFFTTFRDDLEQIVLYSLLPKITELEKFQQQKFFERL